jgi:hypothetical protein
MKKIILSFLLTCLYTGASAQNETAKPANTAVRKEYNPVSMEQMLGLPTTDTLISCQIIYREGGEIKTSKYAKTLTYRAWLNLFQARHHGEEITVNDIAVKKGDKEMKLDSNTFVVP